LDSALKRKVHTSFRLIPLERILGTWLNNAIPRDSYFFFAASNALSAPTA
jgi:hypothetical protein